MARLQTLKPRLQSISPNRIKVLDTKAGATERIRGRAWMETRRRIALRDGYRCVRCGCVWVASRDQTDHIVSLEAGGSNDDSNLQSLCNDCHEAKTTQEASKRARGW